MGELDRQTELTNVVRNILLKNWDPIRIQEFPEKLRVAAKDEYDEYVQHLVKMILEGRDKTAFEIYLFDIETRSMGQKSSNSRASVAAQILFELEEKFANRH